jgi:hypothetical protein
VVHVLGCGNAEDGRRRVPCASRDGDGNISCIDDFQLCNGRVDCAQGEDEDRRQCMFYKVVSKYSFPGMNIKVDVNPNYQAILMCCVFYSRQRRIKCC